MIARNRHNHNHQHKKRTAARMQPRPEVKEAQLPRPQLRLVGRPRLSVTIRPATLADIPAITAIHNEGIADRDATMDVEAYTVEARQEWFLSRGPAYPVIVATWNDKIVGWGSLNPFSPRPCYNGIADISLYIARDCRGYGVGSSIMNALIDTAVSLGYYKLTLVCMTTNRPAISVYTRNGFRVVGIYEKHGQIDGRWVDMQVMEKSLK